MTNFYVMTLFPEMIEACLGGSIIGRAREKGIISVNAVNIRDYTLDKHKKVDDYCYSGGAGMLMQPDPVCRCHEAICSEMGLPDGVKPRTVYVTPQGTRFTEQMAVDFSKEEYLIFLCGHYEGIDERALELVATDYVSIGDYVLTGGEMPACIMIDAISRLIPGVLNNEESAVGESFTDGLLEYPQYTRPPEYRGLRVPEILLSGDHAKIEQWKLEQALKRTYERRPEMYEEYLRTHKLPKKTILPDKKEGKL
ncbi:MAG: tRNA (guanosine(37)-N1)-methyltransferase TrmD [Catonella sp.]|nr:tRNA (guanosine(37)-N1)-methyltransferase TrmD [Catonella sp.]MDY6355972.1 tRNA (guanosine(37)-N1)-methyltransferase TrmD [Catonella sp.]